MTTYKYGNAEKTKVIETIDGVSRFIPTYRFNGDLEDVGDWVDATLLTSAQKVDALWRAYRSYQENQITDDISTMYYVEKGVSSKAQECLDWKNTLWTDYYNRKAVLSEDLDFSNNGTIPYSYPEVKEEVEAYYEAL